MERGEASMEVSLKDGIIKVFHGTAQKELFSGTAKNGAWESIREAIIKSCTKRSGPFLRK